MDRPFVSVPVCSTRSGYKLLREEEQLLNAISKPLHLVESEDDKHAAEIRRLLDVKISRSQPGRVWWNECWPQSALHVACSPSIRSHFGAQLLLSDERCDVNILDKDGNTALMLAVTLILEENDKFAQLTKHLLDHPQIDVNIRNDNEATALHVACGGIYVYLRPRSHIGAQLLLDDGRCDVNAEDKHSETPLMRVVQKIETRDGPASKIFILLLKQPQLDVNKKNRLGKGALHHAWKYDRPDNSALELLLKDERCDVNLQDDSGGTLLM